MNKKNDQPDAPVYDEYPFDVVAIVRLFVVGMAVGALGWLLYMMIARFFVGPVFCESPATFSFCRNGGSIAWVSAHVVAGAAMVAVLAKLAVYRPLLVVLAVIASLWMAHSWLGAMTWYVALLWQTLLFGIATAAFGWIARAKTFVLALVLTVMAVIALRLLLIAA